MVSGENTSTLFFLRYSLFFEYNGMPTMKKFALITIATLLFSTNALAVDFGKLTESVDTEKAAASVDTDKLQKSVQGEEIDYKKWLTL